MKIMNEISIFYHANLYPENVIRAAVQQYAEICSIRVEQQENGISCIFSESIADLELTAKEFSNYLIEMVNSWRTV